MKYKKKSYTDIEKVDENGILFLSGEVLDLRECAKDGTCCVGERDIEAEPPYFDFYSTDKPIRVVFDRKGLLSDIVNVREFQKLNSLITNAGFSTLDLS